MTKVCDGESVVTYINQFVLRFLALCYTHFIWDDLLMNHLNSSGYGQDEFNV